jgi:hypothetical protein
VTARPPACVGLCLDDLGGVLAVVYPDPLRLAAVAHVAWRSGWRETGGAAAARTLTRARRRLGLSRWQPVCVVLGSAVPAAGQPAAAALAASAALLARAGLVQSWTAPADRAGALRQRAAISVAERIAPMAADPAAALATGAALVTLAPAVAPQAIEDRELVPPREAAAGWAVQWIDQ